MTRLLRYLMIADPALRARLDDAGMNGKALSFTRKQVIEIAVMGGRAQQPEDRGASETK